MRTTLLVAVLVLVPASTAIGAKPFVIHIDRNQTCNNGEVAGSLRIDNGTEIARTLELPWRNDEKHISHVQPGTYSAFIRADGKLGWRIELQNVKNHENVQLHVGNYAKDTEGCVLVAKSLVAHNGTCALEGGTSKKAFADIQSAMAAASDNGVSSERLQITVIIAGGGS